MANVLIILTHAAPVRQRYYDGIRAHFPNISLNVVDHHSKAQPYLASADALLTFGTMTYDGLVNDAPRLRWIQALGTGTDGIIDLPAFRSDITVTNIRGIHGAPMSEAALMAMLALNRDFPRAVRNRDRRAWERWPAKLLDGKAVGIFGVGVIGGALAPKCKALGMTVIGVDPIRANAPGVDRMVHWDKALQVVGEMDFVVLFIPSSGSNRGIFNLELLSAMKPTAHLINLGRGDVLDEEALIRILKENRIAGAALDVFGEEPLPADHPFWSIENVVITPHLGGLYDRYADDALPTIVHNLKCFLANDMKAMVNIVEHRAG